MIDTGSPLRILTVCTHNRTRSVMVAALIGSLMDERVGPGAVIVNSAGFGPADLAAIPDAVDAMRRRGFDVSGHRSRRVDTAIVRSADLILTAERDHVVRIASIDPPAFRRSMTLPEFVSMASRSPSENGEGVGAWLQVLTGTRTASAYLRAPIEQVDDPTGWSARAFESAVVAIESQCAAVAAHLARALDR